MSRKGRPVDSKANGLIMRNSVFVWIAVGTGLILLIPLIAMQFTSEVNWNRIDFVVMGLLLFTSGSAFVLISRKIPRRRRILTGIVIAMAFLYVWAELAVGIFTNLGD